MWSKTIKLPCKQVFLMYQILLMNHEARDQKTTVTYLKKIEAIVNDLNMYTSNLTMVLKYR
jgi:hypothetical protein